MTMTHPSASCIQALHPLRFAGDLNLLAKDNGPIVMHIYANLDFSGFFRYYLVIITLHIAIRCISLFGRVSLNYDHTAQTESRLT